MSRESDQRIDDILRAINRCQRYVRRLDNHDIDLVLMAEDAIERNLQIIGEAANHLSAGITDAHPPGRRSEGSATSSFTSISVLRLTLCETS